MFLPTQIEACQTRGRGGGGVLGLVSVFVVKMTDFHSADADGSEGRFVFQSKSY